MLVAGAVTPPCDADAMASDRVAALRVAMVCLGNICRSPMAAAVGQAMVDQAGLGPRVVVESFGTAGYHVGATADIEAVAALRRHGWPADGHRARRITSADIAATDLVLCADHSNVADVRRLARHGGDSAKIRLLRSFDPTVTPDDTEVPDPWGGNSADFDHALELIEAACRGLVERLAVTTR
jgi:protein-tyrosine phosphatase